MAVKREILSPTWEAQYTFSPAVITEGGKAVWLAGQVGFVDDSGKSLAGDFDAQVKQTFKNLEKVLGRAGGTLKDIVWMTVYVCDARFSKRFTDLRRDYYPKDFPASTLVTAAGFALPEIMLEIAAVAVVDK
jgi:enamine deaminase RidA (YjgF/YER057c/UK114 family)